MLARKHWDREQIARGLRERQTNLTRLAIAQGLTESACRHAIDRPQLAGEIAIAECLGVSPEEIWPDRYREPLSKNRSNALAVIKASLACRLSTSATVAA